MIGEGTLNYTPPPPPPVRCGHDRGGYTEQHPTVRCGRDRGGYTELHPPVTSCAKVICGKRRDVP